MRQLQLDTYIVGPYGYRVEAAEIPARPGDERSVAHAIVFRGRLQHGHIDAMDICLPDQLGVTETRHGIRLRMNRTGFIGGQLT